VRGSGFSPATLEALVLVESSGESDAIGPAGAAGLTQLSPAAAQRAGLRVRLARSLALTRRIERARRARTARQLRRWRSRYDQRFAPARELRATVRTLVAARKVLGRDDLALAAYGAGVANVAHAVAVSGDEAPSYAQLYFGSGPDRHSNVWAWLGLRGDVGRDFYWKVLAAERVLRTYRHSVRALETESFLQARKNSAEEVLHPSWRTPQFRTPKAIARAWREHVLRAIPLDVSQTHIAVSRFLGQEAHALGRSRRLYRGLRPAALDVLLYIGAQVHALSGAPRLLLTSAVRDDRYQRLLTRINAAATPNYSMHTTGYAFDISRTYSSDRQAAAFQFVLDRLSAVGAIAYIHELAAIHIAVASDAPAKLRLLAAA